MGGPTICLRAALHSKIWQRARSEEVEWIICVNWYQWDTKQRFGFDSLDKMCGPHVVRGLQFALKVFS